MALYSHSKLSTFQKCKYNYKLQYIDKVKVDIPDTIETFLGGLVHETMEKLYYDLKFQKLNTKEELVDFFIRLWDERWTDDILIVKEDFTRDNYKDMGKKYIADYYDRYKPFDQLRTIELETKGFLDLGNDRKYHVRIDRLACDEEGVYYVCDYKTNSRLTAQEVLDEDRQLAMYSLWVRDKYPDAKDIKLAWYFLAFDKQMISERDDEQMMRLRHDTVSLIDEIESCNDYPTSVGDLCPWCAYQGYCPEFKHKIEVESLPEEKFNDDDGVKLVEEYAQLDQQEKEARERKDQMKERLIEFSRQKGVSVVWGSDHKVSIRTNEKIEYPDTEEFKKLLQDRDCDVFTINYQRLLSKVKNDELDQEVLDHIKTAQTWTVRVGKR